MRLRTRDRTPRLASCLLAGALALVGCATPAPERLVGEGWLELRSGALRVVTNTGEERARSLLGKLQLFQRIVATHARATDQLPRVPTTVLLDADSERFRDLIGSGRVAGLFIAGLRSNQIVLFDSQRGLHVLLHEYTHFLLRNQRRFRHPNWYNEGFAEFVAPVFTSATPALGNLNLDRHSGSGVELVHVGDLIGDEPFRGSVHAYYSTAWLLVHYLHLAAAGGGPDRLPQLLRYLDLYAAGKSSREAFDTAFDVSIETLNAELAAYSRRKRLHRIRLELDRYASSDRIEVRAIGAAEAALRAGDVALALGREQVASGYYRSVLASGARDAEALLGLGRAEDARLRRREARGYYERAIALGEPSAELLEACARSIAESAQVRVGIPDAARSAEFERARALYRRALALDPGFAAAHAGLGQSFVIQPQPDFAAGAASLERAHALIASENEILYFLARAYIGLERPAEARRLLEDVIAWERHGSYGAEARELLASLGAAGAAPHARSDSRPADH
jgi:hypothetical protein